MSSTDTSYVHTKDSVILRDSIIYTAIPAESAERVAKDTSSHLETSVATSDAWIDREGNLHHFLNNKSGRFIPKTITIPYKVHSEETYHKLADSRVITVEVEKKLSFFQKTFIAMGKLMALLIVVCVVLLLLKIFRPKFS